MSRYRSVLPMFVAIAMLVGPWLGAWPGPTMAQESEATTIVRMSKAAYLPAAQLTQPLLSIDYGSFVWLELDEANLAILKESGVDFEPQPDAKLLFLARFQFDPLEGEPELPLEQRTACAPDEEGFHLVQFVGPTKDEWLDRLRAAGAIVIQFQPSYAYIVRMTPKEAALVDGEDFVRWVGTYHAAYRIAPSLLLSPQQIIENVDLTIYNDGRVDETIAIVEELGGQFIQQFPATPDGSLVTAIFALPFELVVNVAQLNTVLWVNYSSPEPGFDDEVSNQIVVGNHVAGAPFTGYNAWLTSTGVDGTGVIVADVDTGMDTNNNATAHADIRGRIAAFVSYNATITTDEDGHGTHTGGIIAGNASLGTVDPDGFLYGLGVAPNAQLVVQNALFGAWPPIGGWLQLSLDSYINGAVGSNNSWYTGASGAQGYSAAARTHDIAVRDAVSTTATVAEPLIMVFSAGNSGSGASTITEPKEAKNLIVVGASENLRDDPWVDPGGCGNPIDIDDVAGFSSRGPALDGRVLPNITAPGTFIASLRSATGYYGWPYCSGVIDANYVWMSGTSQAAPHVTGGVALITQWWRAFNAGANPSPAMAKALLINGAVDMGAADIPNNDEGWGRINLDDVINPAVPVIYRDQTTTFGASGQTWSQLQVVPADPTLPLKVTLVWSDAPGPGSGGDTAAWVNDLDLTLAQGATTFRGNWFVGGWSTPGGTADGKNNIENVYIQSPSGVYDVTVTAANIAGDGVPLNADLTDQDFALVCYNCDVTASDLAITKTDSPDPVIAGTPLSYTLEIANNGPGDATGVVVTDILPPGVTLVSAPGCSGTTTLTCMVGDLPHGAPPATFTIVVSVDPSTPNGTILTNMAEVTGNETEPDLSNNTVAEDTMVTTEADLAVTKTDLYDPMSVGLDQTYTLEVTNNGPSDAVNIVATDTLPPELNFESSPDGCAETAPDSGIVTCALASLVSGATATFDIIVSADPATPSGTVVTDTVEVTSDTTDPNPGNNTASEETVVEGTECDLNVPGANIIVGTSGDDVLYGTEGVDIIISFGGNDIVYGLEGCDCLDGGDGDDEIFGGDGHDEIFGGDGDDEIDGGLDRDVIDGGSGDDRIKGNSNNDEIDGRSGNDKIDGGGGADKIDGGSGDDEIKGGSGNDEINGAGGDDEIDGGGGKDEIEGGSGNDEIKGRGGDDEIDGRSGNDEINGGDGNDEIKGRGGDDEIKGGSGDDVIDGGGGDDEIDGGSGTDTCTHGEQVTRCEL